MDTEQNQCILCSAGDAADLTGDLVAGLVGVSEDSLKAKKYFFVRVPAVKIPLRPKLGVFIRRKNVVVKLSEKSFEKYKEIMNES